MELDRDVLIFLSHRCILLFLFSFCFVGAHNKENCLYCSTEKLEALSFETRIYQSENQIFFFVLLCEFHITHT